jgi:hypothetical protein
VDRPLRRAMPSTRGYAAIINIELATGRVRPSADKGLLDPPSNDRQREKFSAKDDLAWRFEPTVEHCSVYAAEVGVEF